MTADIARWLEGLGLGRYARVFADNTIDFDVLPGLTEDDLRELGLTLGDRRRLQAAIKALGRVPPPEAAAARDTAPTQPSEAERRQLTVLFCDLVGSTALSARLDPEEMRDLLRGYQDACSGVIARYDGYVAKFMGDGVYAYFGYPRAHEDDAERAVSAGLGIVEAVGALGRGLNVRIGVATGTVAVGDLIGEGASEEAAIVGEAPNVAARLQELAQPDTVVIGESTHRLVGGLFETTGLGAHALKGLADPVSAWAVRRHKRAESRFEATRGDDLTDLVGRDEELGILLRRWWRASAGEGQVVLISGEPGIGKSRLVRELQERIADEPHLRLSYQCSPYHTNSALHPVIVHLERAARIEPGDGAARRLDKLEAVIAMSGQPVEATAPLLADLLSIDAGGRYPETAMTPQRKKELTLAALVGQLVGLSERQPLLVVFEDAHWIDPTSLELLEHAVEAIQDAAVLMAITYRPDFAAPWVGRPRVTSLILGRLERRDCERMVGQVVEGARLPDGLRDEISARTDGVPLFIEELTRSVVEAGVPATGATSLAIPATLQDSLEARLDRLGPAKETAQIGAVIGREFDFALLSRVAPLDGDALALALGQLVDAGLLIARGAPPEARYAFKHTLVRDTAYGSLLRRNRAELHGRIAERLEAEFPEAAALEPEVVAHHFTEAGLVERAIPYWQSAGRRAARRSALAEAMSHLEKGLELLEAMPETDERARIELDLRISLGPVLISAIGMGNPRVAECYARARELGRRLDDLPRHFAALFGLWIHTSQVDCRDARLLSDDLLELAGHQDDPAFVLQAHHAAWTTAFFQGEPAANVEHSRIGWELYDPELHAAHAFTYGGHDPGVCSRNFSSGAQWLLGRADTALAHTAEGRALAGRLSHPMSLGATLGFESLVHQLRRDVPRVLESADTVGDHMARHGLKHWTTPASIVFRGWALATLGEGEAALAEIVRGVELGESLGTRAFRPYFLGLLGEARLCAGKPDDARAAVEAGLAVAERTGETWWVPELHRLGGEVTLALSREHVDAAGRSFRQALTVARSLGARSLELRAAASLARLWHDAGRRAEARELLAPVYGAFTEGLETADLEEAKALLDALA